MYNILRKKFKNQLLKNFISLYSVQGMNLLLPLITMPYLFKVLGPEKFGVITFASASIMFLNMFVEYGFNLSATRSISIHIHNKRKLSKIYSSVMTTKIFLLMISFIMLSIVIIFFNRFSSEWQILYLTFLFVVGNALFPIWFFQGIEDMKYIALLNLAGKLFFTASVFTFIHNPSDYLLHPLLNGISYIAIGLFSIYLIKKKYGVNFQFQKANIVYLELKKGWDIFIIEFMPNLYNNFATFLLGFFVTMEILGYYTLAVKIINVFNNIMYVIRNVTYPFLNKDYSSFKKISTLTILIGGLLSLVVFFASEYLLSTIFGSQAINSLGYLILLSPTPFIFGLTLSYGTNKLLIFKKDKAYKKIILITSIIGFIGCIVFIPLYGVIASVILLLSIRILIAGLVVLKAMQLKVVI